MKKSRLHVGGSPLSKHKHLQDEDDQSVNTIVGEDRAAQRHHDLYKPKGWIAHGLTALMQLPNSTPLSVLRWTTPEGPFPHIVHLPSREEGRSVKIYVWIPLTESSTTRSHLTKHSSRHSESSSGSRSRSNSPSPAFDGARRPCVVDFHGGSFIMGGPLEQAPWCAALARSGIIAISVHYRLGPTWEFPAALLDAEDVIEALLDHSCSTKGGEYMRNELSRLSNGQIEIDETKIGLSGFSSGGNIALNMLLSIPAKLNTSKAGGRLDPQPDEDSDEEENGGDWPSPFLQAQSPIQSIPTLLFFPSLDARQPANDRTRPEGLAAPGEVSKWIGKTLENAYLPKQFVSHLRASPGLAPIGMPGGLQDEIKARKEAAERHGVPTSSDQTALSTETVGKKQSAANLHSTLDCLHPATRAILILPEIDNLSEQSEVWVDALGAAEKVTISPEKDGSMIGKLLQPPSSKQAAMGHVRVHRIEKMSHGFTTYPDSFIDDSTKQAKHLVMEQARQFMVNMFLED